MNRARGGWTLIELIVVIAVIAILAATMGGPPASAKNKARRIACVNNLKLIGTAYRIWNSDGDKFPAQTPSENGGWQNLTSHPDQGINCWTNYAIMAKQLETPRVLVCPSDKRISVTNFVMLRSNANVSYFVGSDASDTVPESVLGGDRNLSPGLKPGADYGYSPLDNSGNDVILQTNSTVTPVCWSQNMHSAGNQAGAGNILLGDQSVQQVSSSRFRSEYQPLAGIPKQTYSTNTTAPTAATFRLIFP